MLLKEIGNWKLVDPENIIEEFGLEEELEEKYGVPIDEFDFGDIGETVIIEELLDNIPDQFFHCTFIEIAGSEGYYHIIEFELPDITAKNNEILGPIENLKVLIDSTIESHSMIFKLSLDSSQDKPLAKWTSSKYIVYATPDYDTESISFNICTNTENEYIIDSDSYKGKIDSNDQYLEIVKEYLEKLVNKANNIISTYLQAEDLLIHKGKELDIKGQRFIMSYEHEPAGYLIAWENKDYFLYATPNFDDTIGVPFDFFLKEDDSFIKNQCYEGKVTTADEYFTIIVDYISKFLDDRKSDLQNKD